MRYGSLCTGIGGLDLAVEQVWPDAKPAWFCEADPHAARVLERWWDVPILPDLKTQEWSTVEPVDLITAGYPCQPFSQAGRRQGAADPRHLWPFVIAAVRILRPRLVVLENVAGHLGLGFDSVLGDLTEAGFHAEWCVVSASAVGACHRRERLFVVAHTADGLHRNLRGSVEGPPAGGQWGAEGDGRRPEPRGAEVAADASGERFGATAPAYPNGRRLEGGSEPHRGQVEPGLEASRRNDVDRRHAAPTDTNGGGRHERSDGDSTRQSRAQRVQIDAGGSGRVVADADGMAGSSAYPRGRRPSTVDEPRPLERAERLHRVAWGDYEPAIRRWEHIIGRPAPCPIDEKGRLSVTFVEWMQGFDEGWVGGLQRTAALRCLGNAVVPQQGVLALSSLLHSDGQVGS